MPLLGNTTTIKVAPSGLSPTYNETIFVLESPNIQSTDFQWKIDIWIDGKPNAVGSIKISTIVILPNPNGFGVVDVQRHIENYITSTFHPADKDTMNVAPESYRRWSLDITESFSNTKWRFETNKLSVGNVGFINTVDKHPFFNGDVVTILQDTPFTHGSYNAVTTLTVVDENEVTTLIPFVSSTGAEPGLITLDDKGLREINQDIISDVEYQSFNGVINFADFNTFDGSIYDMSTGNPSALFLTNIPDSYELNRDDPLWINGYSSSLSFIRMNVITDNGDFFIDPISPVPPINDTYMIQSKVGYQDLLNTTSTVTVTSGSLPIVDVNTTFINVTPLSGATQIGETKRFTVIDKCSKYENIKLFFLDRFGSYIPMNFDRVSIPKTDMQRSNYKQNYGNYDSVANAWGYTTHARGTTTYDITSKKSITCTSDWLTDEQVVLMEILLNSPDVYYIDEDGVYRAITITTNTFEEKKRVSTKLLNYTITFEYANNNGNQRG